MLFLLLMAINPIADFERPMAPYGPGHRGIDLEITNVRSPIDGHVSFVGKVFSRHVITIEGENGKFSFEPVCSNLEKSETVTAGQIIGVRCDSEDYEAHCFACVHVSYRSPDYLNPLWVTGLREPSRAVSGPGMGLRIALSEAFD